MFLGQNAHPQLPEPSGHVERLITTRVPQGRKPTERQQGFSGDWLAKSFGKNGKPPGLSLFGFRRPDLCLIPRLLFVKS